MTFASAYDRWFATMTTGTFVTRAEVVSPAELRALTKKAVGEEMVNALRERIARVVVPPVVRN